MPHDGGGMARLRRRRCVISGGGTSANRTAKILYGKK